MSETGRAARVGETGRSRGMGNFKKAGDELVYRIRSVGPVKLKKIRTANTEMQIAVIIGVPDRRVRPLFEAGKFDE